MKYIFLIETSLDSVIDFLILMYLAIYLVLILTNIKGDIYVKLNKTQSSGLCSIYFKTQKTCNNNTIT